MNWTANGWTICPPDANLQARLPKPVYETLEGWKGKPPRAPEAGPEKLPANAIKYVRLVEELISGTGGAAVHQPRSR